MFTNCSSGSIIPQLQKMKTKDRASKLLSPKCCHLLLSQPVTSPCIFLTLHHLAWNSNNHSWENREKAVWSAEGVQ